MELIRKNIHMDRIKCSAESSFTLEDDRNVSDQKPDMERIILRRGEIKTEEIKALEDKVSVKGKLIFTILYGTKEGGISCMEGELPFEEQIYMDGIKNGDNIELETKLEDLSIEMINSRKLSIRALLLLAAEAEELYDEELAVDLEHEEEAEIKKEQLSFAETAVLKKDILRRREELEMPQNFPNIFEIVWKEMTVNGLSFEPLEDQLAVQGEIEVFLLYEGEGEEEVLQSYEKTIPFREIIDCQGSRNDMMQNISGHIGSSEMEIRTDEDGEERIVCLELILDLHIRLYRSEKAEVVTDVYGIRKRILPVRKTGIFNGRLVNSSGKIKLNEQVKLPAALPGLSEILHSSALVSLESAEHTEDGMELMGTLKTEILYRSAEQELASFTAELPFQYILPIPDVPKDCRCRMLPALSQLSASAGSSSEVDIKAVISFELLGFDSRQEELVTDISAEEEEDEARRELPGMVVYFAKEGDDIWELGKKYYVPLDRIREINQLESDRLKAGEKILVVR